MLSKLTAIGRSSKAFGLACAASCAAALAGCSANQIETSPKAVPLVVAHVTVIDTSAGREEPDMSVVVKDGVISEVAPAGSATIPPGSEVVDGKGRFLIPGLCDMHVHTTWDRKFIAPLLIANGVTCDRDMFAKDFEAILEMRGDVAAGRLLAPRIVAAGPIVDGPAAPWPGSIIVRSPEEGRRAVDKVKRRGFDFVKVYSFLDRPTYFAIADESRRLGIPFGGHVTVAVSDQEASDAGQHSVEHLEGVLLSCSSQEATLRAPLAALLSTTQSVPRFAQIWTSDQAALAATYDAQKAQALFEKFRKNRTWQVPTLTTQRNLAFASEPKVLLRGVQLQYAPPAQRLLWSMALNSAAASSTPAQAKADRAVWARELEIVGEMNGAGVPIMAGTDTPNPFIVPGFALHDELANLVEAGLTPMQALQTATRNPAIFLGRSDTMGAVEKGKVADLVLLDADPIADIHNSRRIEAVVFGGRLIPRAKLDAILAQVQGRWWYVPPSAWTILQILFGRLKFVLLAAVVGLALIIAGLTLLIRRLFRGGARTATADGGQARRRTDRR
jgi:cytosine/adenosine deaminase-related metal-dependent hydrolase